MNLLLRLAWTVLRVLFQSRISPVDPAGMRFRVLPNDLDLNFHMNNGRYCQIMDLGRIHMIGRQGLLQVLFRRRWRAIVASETIQFRRSLKIFDTYDLTTRVVGWDEKSFYVEQRFVSRGKLVALAYVKGLFIGKNTRSLNAIISPIEVLREIGYSEASPVLPPAVEAWQECESSMTRTPNKLLIES